jgi:hypothetical protein
MILCIGKRTGTIEHIAPTAFIQFEKRLNFKILELLQEKRDIRRTSASANNKNGMAAKELYRLFFLIQQ